MINLPKFVTDEEEFQEKLWFIKTSLCPHCKRIGNLILHGFLTGYGTDNKPGDKRGRRVFCSNRRKHSGCGRTFSIFFSNCLNRFSVRATELWSALKQIAAGKPIYKAFQHGERFSPSFPYHIWRTFKKNITHIRSCLLGGEWPPERKSGTSPFTSTVEALKHLYQGRGCPVSLFQKMNNKPFFRG